uniref:Uncharacterized protein n=1 Tax=Anguilla anguilla TaxID=7936 RepID=A0A0E9WVS1_ANGAN
MYNMYCFKSGRQVTVIHCLYGVLFNAIFFPFSLFTIQGIS